MRNTEGVAAVMTEGVLLALGRALAHMISRRLITAINRVHSHASLCEVETLALG
jgi:hypothetical protein